MNGWPKEIELTVFNDPEIIRFVSSKEDKATYRTYDGQEVKVRRDERGYIYNEG